MTNKELIEKCRAVEEEIKGSANFTIHPTIVLLVDRLEAAEKEVELYKAALNYSRGTVSELTLSIDRLKWLVRWFRGWTEFEEWKQFPDCPEKTEIKKIVGDR